MKVVIFAGGTGRRLWPISRQKTPKQFEPIVADRSTLQMAVDRVESLYGIENIFISTNERYVELIAAQLPALPASNLIGEPARRDLAAAVGLAMSHIAHFADPNEPVAILWGDNTMQDVAVFQSVMKAAEQLILQNEAKIAFIGETPRFANDNLGWIGMGEKVGEIAKQAYYGFKSLTYRPELEKCRQMYESGNYCWNTGYFVTTPGYIQAAYQQFQPQMFDQLQSVQAAIGAASYGETLHRIYPEMASMSFDDAILVHLDPADAMTLHGEMGWSDPGTLYALKEAVTTKADENAVKGLVKHLDVSDSLLYNYEKGKLLMGVGLEGMLVVNTEDAILVVHKDRVPLVKQAVNELIGTELEKYS